MKAATRVSWGQVLLALLPFVIAGIAKSLESRIINTPMFLAGLEEVDEWALLKVRAMPALVCIVPFVLYRRRSWPIWGFTWAGVGASGLLGFIRHTGPLLASGIARATTEALWTIWGYVGPVGALLVLGWALQKRCGVKWGWYLPLIYLALTGPLHVVTQRAFSATGRIPDAMSWCSSILGVAILSLVAYTVWRLVRETPGRDWLPASLTMLGYLGTQRRLWSPMGTSTEQLVTVALFFLIPVVIAISLRATEPTSRLKWFAGGLVMVWALAVVAERSGFPNWIAIGGSIDWLLYGFGVNVLVPLLPAVFDWNLRRQELRAAKSEPPLPTADGM